MDVPGIVEEALDGEEVAARVSLGGEDLLFVTATRSLVYRGEGLLSDEAVESYSHDAERVTVSEGRRKTKIALTYPIEGTEEITVPSGSVDAAITPIVAGVLHANGVLDPGESVLDTYRFSELTVIVTSDRLVKHVGEAVWDEEYEEYGYDAVTGLGFEEGSVATQIVMEVDGRQERIKAPNERAREVQQTLEEAIREYHGLGPHEDLDAALEPDDDGEDEPEDDGMDFEGGVSPLETSGTDEDPVADPVDGGGAVAAESGAAGGGTDAEAVDESHSADGADDDAFVEAGFEPADEATPDVAAELADLRETVEKQNELLARQQETIEQLIEELRRGR